MKHPLNDLTDVLQRPVESATHSGHLRSENSRRYSPTPLFIALTGIWSAKGYGVQISVRSGADNNEEESNMDFLKNLSPHVHWGQRLSLAATFLFHGASKFPVECLH